MSRPLKELERIELRICEEFSARNGVPLESVVRLYQAGRAKVEAEFKDAPLHVLAKNLREVTSDPLMREKIDVLLSGQSVSH